MEVINVAIPNTAAEKMAAILALSEAINNVSKALVSVSVSVTISNNEINGAETVINVALDEFQPIS